MTSPVYFSLARMPRIVLEVQLVFFFDGTFSAFSSSAIAFVLFPEGAVTDKSQPRHKKYTQFYREEGVFFGIIYV